VFILVYNCGLTVRNKRAKFINRNAPLPLVRVLYNWFSGLSCSVVWNSLIGSPFSVYWEVRQGGVLSPLLSATYVDYLISKLRQSGYGLHIGSLFIIIIIIFYTPGSKDPRG